jgi:Flp pilus assembly pilin Flp
MLRQLLNDESGVIISAELVLVLTIAVLAMIVGLSEVAVAVNTELNDFSNAIGALNHSYCYTGFVSYGSNGKLKAIYAGSSHLDNGPDDCDLNSTCDIVSGASATSTIEGVL